MFLEASAKTAFNVVEAFNLSAQMILQNMEKSGVTTIKENGVKIDNNKANNEGEKKGCC